MAKKARPVKGAVRKAAPTEVPIDALRSPALSAILRLATHPTGEPPVNLRLIAQAARIPTRRASALVDRLADLKLVTVERTPKGSAPKVEIELTPKGRSLAQHVLAMNDLLAQ